LLSEVPEAMGLLALMLLHDARREARVGPQGEMVLLEEQDRSRWDRGKIREGVSIMERLLLMKRPAPIKSRPLSARSMPRQRARKIPTGRKSPLSIMN